MINIFWKLSLLVLIFGTAVYTGLVTKIAVLVTNVNNYVVVFIPDELLFIFSLIGVGLLIKIYHNFK